MTSLRESLLQLPALLIGTIFLVVVFTLNWFGYRLRKRFHRLYPEKEISIGPAEGSLLGLMALLLAFSFNMAATKFENRRQLIIEEANLLNTAILRGKLYPDSVKELFLTDFRNYLDSRISYYDAGDNPRKIRNALDAANQHFDQIWNKNSLLTNDPDIRARAEQMTPVLISIKNISVTREAGRVAPVPLLIIIVLLVLVLIASFVAGLATKPGNRNLVLSLLFAVMIASVIYLILELGRPSWGVINLNSAEEKIVDLRRMFS